MSRCSPLALLLCVAMGCSAAPATAIEEGGEETPSQVAMPTVELAGCAEVGLDTACELVFGRVNNLRIWVDVHAHAAGNLLLTIDGQSAEFQRFPADGGVRLEVAIPELAREITLRGTEPRWGERWSKPIRWRRNPVLITQARDRVEKGDHLAVMEHLAAGLGGLTGLDRLAVLQELRKQADSAGNRSGAVEWTLQAAELAKRFDQPRTHANAASSAAYYEWQTGDLAKARTWLAVLDERAELLPEARVWSHYFGGLIDVSAGDKTGGVRELAAAWRQADRLGMRAELTTSLQKYAIALAELGRAEEARDLVRRVGEIAEHPGLPCRLRAEQRNSRGWLSILLAARGLEHDAPTDLFTAALSDFANGGACPNTYEAANVRVNLAIYAVQDEEPEAAIVWLDDMETVPAVLAPWVQQIRERANLATGRIVKLPSPLERSLERGVSGFAWNMLLSEGERLEHFGFPRVAIDRYRRAEGMVSDMLSDVGIDLGGELFLAGMRSSAERLVRLLLQTGETDRALCHARIARGRELRRMDRVARLGGASPEVRANWDQALSTYASTRASISRDRAKDWGRALVERERLALRRQTELDAANSKVDAAFRRLGSKRGDPTCDELPAIPSGELMLLAFPMGDRWAVFAADEHGVAAVELETAELKGDGRSRSWLDHFAVQILRAHRIRALPSGLTWAVRFHALPFADDILLDVAPVTYGLDLLDRAPFPSRPKQALVIADPSDDLHAARLEADAVSARLRAAGWKVSTLRGREATRSDALAALAEASHLHYAGHGVHRGLAGWGSVLLLPDGQTVGIVDVLALAQVPDTAVLSGCVTGDLAPATVSGGMNLARAFVLAGTQAVVATDAAVSDQLGRLVGERLEVGEADAFAEALRRIQLHVAREAAELRAQVHAFRVIRP